MTEMEDRAGILFFTAAALDFMRSRRRRPIEGLAETLVSAVSVYMSLRRLLNEAIDAADWERVTELREHTKKAAQVADYIAQRIAESVHCGGVLSYMKLKQNVLEELQSEVLAPEEGDEA